MRKADRYVVIIFLLGFILAGCQKETSLVRIIDLTVNHMVNPIGIDETPVFSWKMATDEQGQYQTAYQIFVSDSLDDLENKEYIWDSGKVATDISVAIPYQGEDLQAENDYFWQVRVWDKDENVILSEKACFEMGKTETTWEDARWIMAPQKENVEGIFGSTEYEISYDFMMPETSTGFIWGAEEGRYGEYYLWQFDTTGEQVNFIMSRMNHEDVLESESILLTDLATEEFMDQIHNVKIVVQNNKADTYLDEELISEGKSITDSEIEGIGLWISRGSRESRYDNFLICDAQGQIIWEENFSDPEDHIFSPYYAVIEDGWCIAGDGYLTVSGFEVPAPMFRKDFELETEKEVLSARMYASAFGIYDVWLNSQDICREYGAPGQSVYSKEVYYRTYDITEYLQEGSNTIGFMLGHGRYSKAKGSWGGNLSLCAQIVIHYSDGSRQVIGTDETWLVYNNGPIRNDDLFSGEYYNAEYEVENWAEADCDISLWQFAELDEDKEEIKKKAAPDGGVVCVDTLYPISVEEPVEGEYVYDFGQNFNGVCQLTLNGEAGQTVVIRYAEYLNTDDFLQKNDVAGTIWNGNLQTADNTDYYTFGEDGEVIYTPTFAYRGFRYVQVSGVAQEMEPEDALGLVLSTDNPRTGYFECSDSTMNQLYEAVYWTQLSNYVDIPTDCPQRDERLGWSGDAQVYAYTGALYADTNNFMEKYIDALKLGQNEDGSYPQIAPHKETNGGENGWSDAGVILVWEMYQQYGNPQIIKDNLEAMCRYADYLAETSNGFLRERIGFNDHNAVSYMEDSCINTAQCAYVMNLLSRMCTVVGENLLANKYLEYYEGYKKAWQQNFLNEDGSIGNWLQSDYTLGLAYGLYPEELEQAGADKLKIAVEAGDYHVTTGYVATPHLLPILCKYGYMEEAYKVIQKEGYPSWNYMLSKGATTLTEAWWSFYEDEEGKIGINGSLNHPALGSVGQWFYTDVLGIRRDEEEPAYKHFYLQPMVGGGLTYAKGSYESMYGKIESEWTVADGQIMFHFVIPANTSATVTLPHEEYQEMELKAGAYDFVIEHSEGE